MDPLRTDLIAAAHSLMRLNLRIAARLGQCQAIDQHLVRVKHLQPGSPWIDTMNPDNSISGVQVRTIEVAERLLAMVRADEPIDTHYAAMVMQVVAGDAHAFTSRVRMFAERYNVALPPWVREEPRAHEARNDVMRAVNRITGVWDTGEKESGA